MARPPKKLSLSSGQGVSRRSYQVGRNLGMAGTGAIGAGKGLKTVATGGNSASTSSSTRDYAKKGASHPWNIAFDETAERNPNLKSLKEYPK